MNITTGLKNSAHALNIPYTYSTDELIEATYEVLRTEIICRMHISVHWYMLRPI